MKTCFIGGGISKALRGDLLGGAEKQLALIINGLKSKGLDVVVFEYHLDKEIEINGIKFYPAWNKEETSFINKIIDIYKKTKQLEIERIYCRGTDLYAGILFSISKLLNSKLRIFWGIAGDHDLTSKFNYLRVLYASSWYEKFNLGVLFNFSSFLLFYSSDIIICQTEEQIAMCNYKFKKKKTVLISNIYSQYYENDNLLPVENEVDAIWIGKFSGNKGEDVLLKIAMDIPSMTIMCLGHVTDNFKNTDLFKKIKNQNNLILKGRVYAKDVGGYISKADFVLNTSPSEGFSNVFLEGWYQAKPVVSLKVNPNQYLSKGEAGYCAENTYTRLIIKLKSILKNKEFMSYHGKKGNEILKSYHLSDSILPKYYNLFNK